MKNGLFFLLGFIGILLQSCENSQTEKVEYLFESGTSSVRLNILSGNDYLLYETPTRLDFEWTNIDPNTTMIGGTGIKMLGIQNGISQTEFTVPKHRLQTDTLHITVLFKKDGKRIPAAFHIPMRYQE